jgi:hypothetical protein
MENLLFTGIQSIFLRAHNRLVAQAPALFPDFSGIQIYEFAREYITGAFQTISFALWIPQLLGEEYGKKFLKEITTSPYNENVSMKLKKQILRSYGIYLGDWCCI